MGPANGFIGLDCIAQGREFSLLRRAFGATIKRVCSRDEQRVHAVGDGCRGLHGRAALTEGIQIQVRGTICASMFMSPPLRFIASRW